MSDESLPLPGEEGKHLLTFSPIAIVHSCFKEKFGIPRQPGLVSEARAIIELLPPYNVPEAVEGLELCSHIWVHFIFHANQRQSWKPKVKPPRLGGNKSMGVFATRAPVRPNPIGMSVVLLEKVMFRCAGREGVFLAIAAHDLLDGTPVIDIKPYVPYADALLNARNDFAVAAPHPLKVAFSESVELILSDYAEFKQLLVKVLGQDPRPAYQKGKGVDRVYGVRIDAWNIRWEYSLSDSGAEQIDVIQITPC